MAIRIYAIMTDVSLIAKLFDETVIRCLISGGVIVARTDTLYGVLARADDPDAVEKVYQVKGRSPEKSPIVLVAETSQIYDSPSDEIYKLMQDNWPGKVSIIVPSNTAPTWLRRDNSSVAYRLPDDEDLRGLIRSTGPLIAPSANPQGFTPAMNINQAIKYFGESVDIYVDGGEVNDVQPSRLLRVNDYGEVERLR